MNTYEYTRWSGGKRKVQADKVEFTATHVLFYAGSLYNGYSLVLGEREMQVNELREIVE